MRRWQQWVVPLATLLWTLPVLGQTQDFLYETNNDGITLTITAYTGPGDDVTIPDRLPDTNGLPVTCIGDQAFISCSRLTSVTIPNSVTAIGYAAFALCSRLTNITVLPANPAYSSLDGVLFSKDQTELIQCPGGKAGSYTIPNSVTNIADAAFWDCGSLTSVTIPESVTAIGDFAFAGCSRLTNITVLPANPAYSSLDGVLFNKDQTVLIECPAAKVGTYTIPNSVSTIGNNAFFECISLTSVTIPNSVTGLGVSAFDSCQSLTNVLIGNGVTCIGERAFNWCTSLISVTIPDSVNSIGGWAFFYCPSLRSVYFQGNAPTPGRSVLDYANNAILYYLPGTTGWGPSWAYRPTALWQPKMLTPDAAFGVQTNQFSFNIAWASNMVTVVEATSDLASPTWQPLQTNTLPADTLYFSDPDWTNSPRRFYRIRWPGPSAP